MQNRMTVTAWALLLMAWSAVVAVPVSANVYLVDTEADLPDASPGDGICAAAGGSCSLRAAVEEANTLGATSEIELPAGHYALLASLDVCDHFSLECPARISIQGEGREASVIDAAGNNHAFLVISGGTNLDLRSLSIQGASAHAIYWYTPSGAGGGLTAYDIAVVGNGGGILLEGTDSHRIENSSVSWNSGTGIEVNSPFTVVARIVSSTILGNGGRGLVCFDHCELWVEKSRIEGNQDGGVLLDDNTLAEIESSTITGNRAPAGAGILLSWIAKLRVKNSTISGNTAAVEGGGISATESWLWLENVTVTANRAERGGGLAIFRSMTMRVRGSIVASNEALLEGPDCVTLDSYSVVNSDGFNLIGDPSDCVFTPAPSDQVGSPADPLDPVLGPLRQNGGPTPTHALLAGSPAIDAIPVPDCVFIEDQRGVVRPQGTACDIGAYEFARACDDGIDNDEDGLVDYPEDLECHSPSAISEAPIAAGPICGIGPELVLITPLLLLGHRRRQRAKS